MNNIMKTMGWIHCDVSTKFNEKAACAAFCLRVSEWITINKF